MPEISLTEQQAITLLNYLEANRFRMMCKSVTECDKFFRKDNGNGAKLSKLSKAVGNFECELDNAHGWSANCNVDLLLDRIVSSPFLWSEKEWHKQLVDQSDRKRKIIPTFSEFRICIKINEQ